MAETIKTYPSVMPSATPSGADIQAWRALARDEQLRRLKEELSHPDCDVVSSSTVSDILSRAQAAAKLRHGCAHSLFAPLAFSLKTLSHPASHYL